ncbi:MAG: deoxyribonuclease IV [Chloroflexi bacterium]|nr:MAG: deoxyribonuclease IV [Chloroflexota bacterium]
MTGKLLLGAHVSTAGGVEKALAHGVDTTCDTIQIFAKPPNRWASKALAEENVAAFKAAVVETGISPVIAHGLYLVNLATPDDALWNKSLDALADDLERCEMLGLAGLVVHPGSHKGSGEEAGQARIAAALDEVHARLPGYGVQVWLEITAGQGDHLGYTFGQIRQMIDSVAQPERLGVCFDTAHAWAAGYEIRTREGFDATWDEFDRVLGLERLRAVHLNDTSKELGSRVDRHEQVGKGKLGLDTFRFLVNDPRFRGIPMVLELDLGDDEFRENLKTLRSLVAGPG